MFLPKYLIFVAMVLMFWEPPKAEAGVRKWVTDHICIPFSRGYRRVRYYLGKIVKEKSFYITTCIAQALFLHDRIGATINDKTLEKNEKLCMNQPETTMLANCETVFENKYFPNKVHWTIDPSRKAECVFVDVYSSKHDTTYKGVYVLRCPAKTVGSNGSAGGKKKVGDKAGGDSKEADANKGIESEFDVYIASALNKYSNKRLYYVLMPDGNVGKTKAEAKEKREGVKDENSLLVKVKALLFNIDADSKAATALTSKKKNGK